MGRGEFTTVEGALTAAGLRFGIVCSRFNDFFVSRLLEGAVDCITRHGGATDGITVVHVPGSFEIPAAAQRLARSQMVDAVIALGVIIRGETSHADHIAGQVAAGLGSISLDTGIPVIFGIVTAETVNHAIERSGSKAGNRGVDAALAAIEMANVLKQLDGPASH